MPRAEPALWRSCSEPPGAGRLRAHYYDSLTREPSGLRGGHGGRRRRRRPPCDGALPFGLALVGGAAGGGGEPDFGAALLGLFAAAGVVGVLGDEDGAEVGGAGVSFVDRDRDIA